MAGRINEAAVSPAPCEEGVFYVIGAACQPFVTMASEEAIRLTGPSSPCGDELRSSGEHSTEYGEFVKREISKRLRKTQVKTSTFATITACNVGPSPAADAYFTDFPGAAQGLDEEKCRARVASVTRR